MAPTRVCSMSERTAGVIHANVVSHVTRNPNSNLVICLAAMIINGRQLASSGPSVSMHLFSFGNQPCTSTIPTTAQNQLITAIVFVLQISIPYLNFITFLALLMIGFTEYKQGLHDLASKTYVVTNHWEGAIPLEDNFGA